MLFMHIMATSYVQACPVIASEFAESYFRNIAIKWVPVVQRMGHSSAGKKICMHVHEEFAYLCISYCGAQSADRCLRKFDAILEKAVNVGTQFAVPSLQLNISHVSCIDKYGHTSEEEHFHKFYPCTPSNIQKVTYLLLRVTLVNKSFQLHKFHLPNPLQLFIGYNFCCPMADANTAMQKFRKRAKGRKDNIRNKSTIMDTSLWDTAPLKVQSAFITASVPTSMNIWREDYIPRMNGDMAEIGDTWSPNKDDDFIKSSDDEDDSDDDCIPQFDGSSDKVSGSPKKCDQSQLPATISHNAGCFQESGDTSKNQAFRNDLTASASSDMAWRTGTAGSRIENSQNYMSGSWAQQDLSQKSDSGGRPWHGHSQTWMQQHYQSLPNQHCIPSTYPSQQTPFRSPSSATFQSPPHNPYASPTHQQTIQTPSPSQYQYPPYQSSPSNQSYQQPYQSPSQLPHHSPQSSQVFHSSQSYNSSSPHQPYQSPSASQSYQLPGVTNNLYQSSNKPSPTGNQLYQSQSAGITYQSSQGNPFQSTSAQIYHSPYQSSSHLHPKPYQSPGHDGCYPTQLAWSPQGYSGYNQGPMSNLGAGPPSRPEKYLGESSQSHPGILYKQPVNPGSNDQGSFFSSLGIQQEEQAAFITSAKRTDTRGTKAQSNQKTNDKKRKRNAKTCELPQSVCLSPAPSIISKSPIEIKSSSIASMPLISEAGCSQSDSQDYIKIHHDDIGNNISAVISSKISSTTVPVTKISTLEFKPNVTLYSSASLNKESSTGLCQELLNSSQSSGTNVEKIEIGTSTPMIQQLLMEEPVRMNIKEENREAVMKKPMASPIPPKPKRKYKKRVSQGVKKTGRPPSNNLSSTLPSILGHCGFSSQPITNPPTTGPPGRSHSVSLPFTCEPRMPSSLNNYGWHNWKQENFPTSSQWQEQQQWRMNEWQSFDNSGDTSYNTMEMNSKSGMAISRSQQRSFSVDSIQSNICHKNLQPNQIPPLSNNQDTFLNNSADILQPLSNSDQNCSSRESVGDRSSLSSLFQLVSEVGSDDTCWESTSVSVLPNLFSNSSDSETPIAMPVSDVNQESPSAKDFITLETPCKQAWERTNADTTHKASPEESDSMEFDLSCDLKPKIISRSFSLGTLQPRVGKQNRAMKFAFLQTRDTVLSSAFESNPAYTYTFHVPTTIFKKLKFFRGAESRKHNIRVVRMHPMDARRYSLLKIGREIVKAVKLTEADLANYNVTLPSPYQFVSADGSSNRVNLDIPTVSVDKQNIENSNDNIIFSKFDTDFPPNKVAPPSTFHANQIMARASSGLNRRSSVGSNCMQQPTIQQTANYKEEVSPGSQRAYSPQELTQHQGERSVSTGLQQMPQCNMNSQFSSQHPENSSDFHVQHFNQKRNCSYAYSVPPSVQDNCYPNQQGLYTNHQLCPEPQQHYQEQQYQVQQQHQQTGSSGFDPEPKNGLRSPGQHGLASTIENGSIHDQNGDEEVGVYKTTTKSSHFNTRVNAQRWDNHAEHKATKAAQCTNACTNPQPLGCLDTIDQLNDRKNICKTKQQTLSISRASQSHSFDNDDSLSATSENNHENHKDEINSNKYSTDNYDVSKTLSELCKLKNHKTDTSFILQNDKHREKLCRRRNTKALVLTIPKSQSNVSLLDLNGTANVSDMGRNSVTLKESGGSEEGINNKNVSSLRRSMRSSRLEDLKSVVGGRRSPRQAKLRSVYSKCPHNLKPKKRRKRHDGSLLEGIHYIVVGKFKGHQAMLVKVKKLTINPKESVKADLFEELSAKEIVRVVAHVNTMTQEMSDKSEPTNYLSSSADCQSNAEIYNPQYKYENPDPDQHYFSRSESNQRASRGRSKQNVMFRSAAMSSIKLRKVLKESSRTNSLRNTTEPKNVLAGPTSGASENNVQSTYFMEDNFFFMFKESFIRHNKVKEQAKDKELKNHENVFFEGVRTTSFLNFQQRFIANVHKLESDNYSSSSDDEDEVLDKTFFKEKMNIPHTLDVLQIASESSSCKSKCRHFAAKDNLWNGTTAVNDVVNELSDLCDRRRFKLSDMPKTSESEHNNEWTLVNDNGSYVAQDGITHLYDIVTYNGIPQKSTGLNNRFLEREESGKHSLKEMNEDYEVSTKLDLKTVKVSNETKAESSVYEQNCHENPLLCSVRNSKDEEMEDYLKCQMAFFEDISSDSDSSDTIITDKGKENVFAGNTTNLYPPFSITASCLDKFVSGNVHKGAVAQDKNQHVVSQVLELSKHPENSEIYSTDLRFDNVELPGICRSNHNKPQVCINDSKQGETFDIIENHVSNVFEKTPEFSQEGNVNIVNITDQGDNLYIPEDKLHAIKDISPVSEYAAVVQASSSAVNSDVLKHLETSKLMCRSEIVDDIIDPHLNKAGVFMDSSQSCKRRGRSLKISNRNRDSKLYKRKQSLDDGNLSSNDETGISLDSDPLKINKCLRQRKRPWCTHYVQELDSFEDATSGSSNEDFSTCALQHKGSKNNRWPKEKDSIEGKKRKLSQVSMNTRRAVRGRHRVCPRGRRKKPPGGDKLLNSLSLLHMATLANLTETQSDPANEESEMSTVAEKEKCGKQLSYRLNKDYNISCSTQDQVCSVSPKDSPVVSSLVGKKRWKHTRRRCVMKDTSLSMRNLKFSKRYTNLKPRYNEALNVSNTPLPFSNLVNNFSSSSPVPSNFMFNHIPDSPHQPDVPNPSQDVSINNTLQLLETRRAQVNCASFSMKDILKLTTLDDSMDSDSKDSVALVKPSGSRRAQVKSTTLSLGDILKLTSVDKSSEIKNSLPKNMGKEKFQLLPKNMQMLDVKLSLPNSQTLLETPLASCNVLSNTTYFINTNCQPQMETLETPDSLLTNFNSSPSEQTFEATEASPSLLSQMANFQNSVLENCASNSKIQTASYLSEEKMPGITNEDKIEVKAKIKSVSLTNSDCGISHCNSSSCDKSQYTGNMTDKHVGDDFRCKVPVVCSRNEINKKSNMLSKQNTPAALQTSPMHVSTDVKCVLKPLSSSSSTDVKEKSTSTSSRPRDLSNVTSLEALSMSSNQQQRKLVDSENIDGLDRPASTPTTGTILQATGIKSASISSTEGPEKLNFDSHPAIPSHIHLQSNVPETPVFSPVEVISGISLTSDELSINENLNHGNHEPRSISSTQESRGNYRNLNVRNIMRGIKPLHPLQIPPYPNKVHGYNSHAEELQTSRNASLHYPYFCQWPAETSGLDPAVSPLNLCTSQKSPNNYSPITPTSPVSPNYPTQAQGVTETDLSPSSKNGKPLWYPWLKTD